ncbi:MAG: glycosyltransferase family 2 protein [Sulfuriferula sp.]|nr:glycosyltransferase family 2 protein [Sulfuriferula sp.]
MLIQKGGKLVWVAVSTRDFKHTRRILSGIISRHSTAIGYTDWIRLYEKLDEVELAKQKELAHALRYKPKFSIVVPTYNTPNQILIEFAESVLSQTYPNWELCIADDASSDHHVQIILDQYAAKDERIKVIYRTHNGHIAEATNTALASATGEYICLMDHDDTIAPNALYEFALRLNEDPSLDFIYSDEDKISFDSALRFDSHFKPDWSPEYLECCMYTAHFACYRTEIVRRTGGFRKEFNGAQDYDFMLRFSEHMKKTAHISKILYHWRTIPGSTATSMDNKGYVLDAAIRALEEHLGRTGRLAFVKSSHYKGCFHARRQIEGSPKVSIVIPSAGRDSLIRGKNLDLLVNCIASIKEKSTYSNLEIVVVDNNDLRNETLAALSKYPVKFVHFMAPVFNVAAKMNLGAKHASGEYLLFLNDDTEVITPDWIEAMLSLAQRPGVGAVGAKLFFEDDTLQHVGVAFCNGLPDHIRRGYPGDDPGYFFSSEGQRNYLAVTGACVLLNRKLFQEVSGFEEAFAVNYNDIDLCLKVWQKGYRNVYTGQAMLYHFESRNRKREVDIQEQDLFLERWGNSVTKDPYYSYYFRADPPNFELGYLSN